MALKKVRELPSGVTGEYWKIIKLFINVVTGEAEATVVLFKDKSFRDEERPGIVAVPYQFKGFTVAQMQRYPDPVTLAYELIKELPEFDGAENV